jgi:hypothetical protein
MSQLPLMPKGTAIWLIENTGLTFDQIAKFCGLHPLEVQGMADGEVAKGFVGIDPVSNGQLTSEEIKRCEADPNSLIKLSDEAQKLGDEHAREMKKKKSNYVPIARRQDKPNAVAWILKHCPEINDQQICKLIGTTKTTINSIRSRTHWNIQEIRAKDPVLLGLCSQTLLDKEYENAKEKAKIVSDRQMEDSLKKILED